LTPAFSPVRMIGSTGGIKTGARVELRVGVFRWVALHTAYEKDRLFVDEQIQGPFAQWVHRHEFQADGARTRLTDRIEYELPGGSLVNLLFGWTVRLGLRNMFSHRHRVTKEVCEKHSARESL
jgi:ligand-binding SRPBCC domain-containing protein